MTPREIRVWVEAWTVGGNFNNLLEVENEWYLEWEIIYSSTKGRMW